MKIIIYLKLFFNLFVAVFFANQNLFAEIKQLEEFKILPHKNLYNTKIDYETLVYYGIEKNGIMSKGAYLFESRKYPSLVFVVLQERKGLDKAKLINRKNYNITFDATKESYYIDKIQYLEFFEGEIVENKEIQPSINNFEKLLELTKYNINFPIDLKKDYGLDIPKLESHKIFLNILNEKINNKRKYDKADTSYYDFAIIYYTTLGINKNGIWGIECFYRNKSSIKLKAPSPSGPLPICPK
tara:strand:- start:79 stop:804 length:726 start_codon:yes stop_codon:yes gene_type:complete